MKIKKILSLAAGLVIALTPLKVSAETSIDSGLMELYYEAPEELREEFESTGWDLLTASSAYLNRTYGSGVGEVAGVTVYGLKTIYLTDNSEYADDALNHEMGHYFEYAYATYFGIVLSETNEFYSIYQSEASVSDMFSEYTVSTSAEYFAEAFKWYCEEPASLSYLYPDTYDYISEAEEEFATAINDGETARYSIYAETMPDEPIGNGMEPSMGQSEDWQMPSMGQQPEGQQMPSVGQQQGSQQMPSMGQQPGGQQMPSVGQGMNGGRFF